MDAVIQSFLSGLPFLLLHLAATVAMLVIGCLIYVRVTPHDEMALIRAGNTAAAISLTGAILGLAIPLAAAMAHSVNLYDIVIWGLVALVVQIALFLALDWWLKDLPQRIEQGQTGAAVLLAGIKLAIAVINAAAVSG